MRRVRVPVPVVLPELCVGAAGWRGREGGVCMGMSVGPRSVSVKAGGLVPRAGIFGQDKAGALQSVVRVLEDACV